MATTDQRDLTSGEHRDTGDDVTVGVLGGRWRGSVTPWGAIEPWSGTGRLDWWIAADDRWHTPAREPAVRSARVEGTAVVETRVRVPQGDVVQRVWAVADHGGLTLIEVHNDSPMPVAIAMAGAPVLSARPPAEVPVQGIELPADAVVFPVGHRSSIVLGLAHGPRATLQLPGPLPTAEQVVRGWSGICSRAGRYELPDVATASTIDAARCELLLGGPDDPVDDPAGFLIGVALLVRMTGAAEQWMPDVAEAVASVARRHDDPVTAVALDAAELVADRAGDARALRDLAKLRERTRRSTTAERWLPEPSTQHGARYLAATERRFVADGDLLPDGIPAAWWGQHFEVHDLAAGPRCTVGFAVRWHGSRPAVLWEQTGATGSLRASTVAPGWSTDAPSGEALWPAPEGTPADEGMPAADEPISFS